MRCFVVYTMVPLSVIAAVQDVAVCQAQQVFFGNLHSHTSYSDGSATPEVAYAHARDVAKLDFLAITEHNHRRAPSRIATDHDLYSGTISISLISTARRFTQDGEFVAIYGQEFSTISSGNHANVFEVGEVIDEQDVPKGEWDKLINTWLPAHLDSQGKPALLLLNHPAQRSSPNNEEYGIDDFGSFQTWRSKLDAHAQLINIINGPSHDRPSPGSPSESEFLRYLNMGLHVAPTADQDNHRENWGNAADTRTGVIASSLTKANILEALRERHVYASEDKNLRVIATVNGELMGTRIQGSQVPSPGSALSIELSLVDPDEPTALYTIDVYADQVGGRAVADVERQFERTGNGTFILNGITYAGGEQYFFLKIRQTDDDHVEVDRVWTAPVWFEPDGATSPPTVPALTLEVNLSTERARITNVGTGSINLTDWTLVSIKGNQKFVFPDDFLLGPGKSVVVTSGPSAKDDPPGFLKWTNRHVWNNSGDPGQLLDPDGELRAATE
ncbi:MAG: CehA/McbA family metallohydrolase [Phycisphaerales bacterium]